MNCPRCGTVLENGIQLCPNCGADIVSIQMAESAAKAEQTAAQPANAERAAETTAKAERAAETSAKAERAADASAKAEQAAASWTDETSAQIQPICHDTDGDDPGNGPYIEPMMSQSRFYEKTWFIILALILFWPLGLVLMWIYADWNKVVKIIVTAICALAVINIFR